MVEYSREEQLIARSLLDRPKTTDELREELGISLAVVNEAIAKLIKLRVVERFDDQYRLIGVIEKQLKGFQGEVKEVFKVRMTIEALSESKEALEKQMEILETRIKMEKVKVIKLVKAEAEQQGDNFSSFIELEFYASAFNDALGMVINYGPSTVELLEPKEFTVGMPEAQETLNQVMSAVHYYIGLIVSLKYKELAEKKAKTDQKQPELDD